MSQASIQDILDLKRGNKSQGCLRHEGCGGQIVYSVSMGRFQCTHGDASWSWAWVDDRALAEGKPGLYQWRPPVYRDGF